MANNHEQFIAFDGNIKASDSRRKTLKTNRDALREKVRKYFKENWPDKSQPRFFWQGSYAMFTLLSPIKDENGLGAYDLDDGIYFEGAECDRESADWYHDEVYNAVKDHTKTGADNNKPCVTVNYADGHHVDLPIYYWTTGEDHPKLAHLANPWMGSDPKELWSWFNGRSEHPQLRRIVRYLKAWADYIEDSKDKKMPTGCSLMMLAVKHYSANDRDDIALKDVLVAMYDELSGEDGFHCYRPTYPVNEDLYENYSATRKNNFLTELKLFKDDAERAINSKNQKEGCLKWQKHFGDRFPCSNAKDEDEDVQQQSRSGILTNNSRFA
jgi:hypothetical protein